ncbi:MAG: hypothetical protein U9M90_00870 [Patescibacteria group bacterium]|nr:hypothetical protein [Patescibacteria group bacterium]
MTEKFGGIPTPQKSPENPKELENKHEKERKKENVRNEMIALAKEFSESGKSFPFPGISRETYSKMEATDKEFPGYSTPVDELLEKFKKEGMKVVPGKRPMGGTVYVLPLGSNDIESDGIFPECLEVNDAMDEKLKELISKRQEFVSLC